MLKFITPYKHVLFFALAYNCCTIIKPKRGWGGGVVKTLFLPFTVHNSHPQTSVYKPHSLLSHEWAKNEINHLMLFSYSYIVTVLKLINYSCSSYPTRASYSGRVDGFRNLMKNELKTRPCLKPLFETISNTDANFLNLHIDKATKTSGDKQLYLITHFTKQTLNLNYLVLTLNVTEQFLKNPKQKRSFFF